RVCRVYRVYRVRFHSPDLADSVDSADSVDLLAFSCWCGERLRRHGHVGPDFLRAFNDDHLAGFQAVVDDPIGADALADMDGADADFVVRADDGNAVAALQLGDGALRHQQRALPRAGDGADAPVFAGAQRVARIREEAGQLDRAGLRVNAAVGHVELAPVRIDRAIRQHQFKLDFLHRPVAVFDHRAANGLEVFLL